MAHEILSNLHSVRRPSHSIPTDHGTVSSVPFGNRSLARTIARNLPIADTVSPPERATGRGPDRPAASEVSSSGSRISVASLGGTLSTTTSPARSGW